MGWWTPSHPPQMAPRAAHGCGDWDVCRGSSDCHLNAAFIVFISFHIKVTGLKCLQEDATISQVSGDIYRYITM